jgi:hypothetical protein
MKTLFASFRRASVLALMGFVLLASGCATNKIDWAARVGNYTFDQAVVEIGPPDKQARLQDGTIVAEWLTRRGYSQTYIAPGYYGYQGYNYGPMFPTVVDTTSPDYFLRLTFGPDGRLKEWKRFAK